MKAPFKFPWHPIATVAGFAVLITAIHPSGRRRIVTRPEFGYQPIDRQWEETGEWSTWSDDAPSCN